MGMLYFGSKERIADFLVVKKRGSLNLWKQERSRSRSSADCSVRLVLVATFIAHTTRWVPSRSSAALVACHRALPARLLGVLTCHRVLPARPRHRLIGALPSPHVAARCRILDCTPDRSAASL